MSVPSVTQCRHVSCSSQNVHCSLLGPCMAVRLRHAVIVFTFDLELPL
jgi:hypothetical protein